MEPGQRVFDILVNGRERSRAFDILERSGGVLRGTVETFAVKTQGGVLSIELKPCEGSVFGPLVNGIEMEIMAK